MGRTAWGNHWKTPLLPLHCLLSSQQIDNSERFSCLFVCRCTWIAAVQLLSFSLFLQTSCIEHLVRDLHFQRKASHNCSGTGAELAVQVPCCWKVEALVWKEEEHSVLSNGLFFSSWFGLSRVTSSHENWKDSEGVWESCCCSFSKCVLCRNTLKWYFFIF